MTPTEKRLAKIVELGEAVLFAYVETAGSMTDEQMQRARQRLHSIGREVSRLPEKFKAAYKSSVPWEAMSEWADIKRFDEASFNLEALTGCCETLEVALPELSRHCGGHTSIQEKVAAGRVTVHHPCLAANPGRRRPLDDCSQGRGVEIVSALRAQCALPSQDVPDSQ